MNRQGQMALGGILLLFLGVIVAFALLPAIADNISVVKDSRSAVNTTVSLVLDTPVAVEGQELIGAGVVSNITTGATLVGNLTVDEGLSASDGGKSVQVTLGGDGTIGGINYSGLDVYLTYEYGADGYAPDSGARGMANLIVIGSALAILGFAVALALKNMKFG